MSLTRSSSIILLPLLLTSCSGSSSSSNSVDKFKIDGANNENRFTLNDTGVTVCYQEQSFPLVCDATGFPEQDAMHGRDAMYLNGSLVKIGGGLAGFDFTKLDSTGQTLDNQDEEYIVSPWSCVLDNHTGLYWEVKTNDGGMRDGGWIYTWHDQDSSTNGGDSGVGDGGTCIDSMCDTQGYIDAVNSINLCGYDNWRVPTREELRSIVNYGFSYLFDYQYFPNAFVEIDIVQDLPVDPRIYWTANSSPDVPQQVWTLRTNYLYPVDLHNSSYAELLMPKNVPLAVRLVRQGDD